MKLGIAIAVACHKGGAGKTTTVQSLAGYYALSGKKVLIIDTDEQANIKTVFGLRLSESEGGLASILMEGLLPDTMIHNTSFENIDVILSGGRKMKEFEEEIKIDRPDRFLLMRKLCSELKHQYDVILVDTPPALSLISSNVIAFADYVLLTSEPEMLSTVGAKSTVQFILEIMGSQFKIPTPKILGLLFTRFDQRRRIDMDMLDDMDNFANKGGLGGGKVFTPIRMDAKIRTAQIRRRTIFHYAPTAKSAEDYKALAEDMLEQIAKDQNTKRVPSKRPIEAVQ